MQSTFRKALARYKRYEMEQKHLLDMMFRKVSDGLSAQKWLSGSDEAEHRRKRDLAHALSLEIDFRRRLKAQALKVMERVCIQRAEDVRSMHAECEKLKASTAKIRGQMSRSTRQQEDNTSAGDAAESLDVYDWIIDINLLSDLADTGWKLEFSKRFGAQRRGEVKERGWKGAVVAVVGLYDKGKTFILNQITRTKLPSGKKVRTKGLSFKHLNVDGTDFVLLDSAGSNAPVRVENELSVYQKEATEHFILDIIFEISDYFICVVNDFTSLDQRYLDKLARTLQGSRKAFREVIVVHNFKDVTSVHVLEHLWDTQVTQIYKASGGATMRTHVAARDDTGVLTNKTVVWFKTKYSRHLCLAEANSALGRAINPWAVSLLRYWLKSVVVPVQRELSITNTVVGLCSEKLAVCFKEQNIHLEVSPSKTDPLVSFIRPANPEHNKRFRLPQITLHGSSVVLARPDSFMPPVDITRDAKQFTVRLDTPGLGPEDIYLSRVRTTTVIRGRREPPFAEGKAGKTQIEKQERKYGDFTVPIAVPTEYKKRWHKCSVDKGVLIMTFLADSDEFELQPNRP